MVDFNKHNDSNAITTTTLNEIKPFETIKSTISLDTEISKENELLKKKINKKNFYKIVFTKKYKKKKGE